MIFLLLVFNVKVGSVNILFNLPRSRLRKHFPSSASVQGEFCLFLFELIKCVHQAFRFHFKQSENDERQERKRKYFTVLQTNKKILATRDARDENIFTSHSSLRLFILFPSFICLAQQRRSESEGKKKTLYNETLLLALHCFLIYTK